MFKNAAPILQAARDLEGMQILIDAYRVRPESANDPLLPFYNAELDDLRKQYKEAEALLKPLVPLATVKGQEHFATEYLYSAELAGDSIEAYGIAPDKSAAFLLLAGRLLLKKDDATLTQLVDLHIQGFPSDPWPYYYQARMHQAANEYDAADTAYAKAMSLDTKGTETFRLARVSARFYAGNGLSAYQDIEPRDKVFTQLCGLFALKKQAEGLANLVAARRADAPEDPNVPLWDADARFLDGDYMGAVNVLDANRATIQAVKVNGIQVNLYRFRDIYIRSQVRLKQFDAARAEAVGSQGTEKDWFHLAVVECAAGNVPDAIKAMDALLADDDYDESDLYRDPDIGPALATPAFAAWRQKHPDSTTQPAATQATH